MKIAFNPSTVEALIAPPNNKDITFDLRGRNIFARGVKFCGTDTNTWRDIKINNVSIGSNILDLRNGSNTTLTNTNGVVTINSTWRPVVDNLTSDSTTSSLSAKQGKVLKSLIDGKSNSGHTHDDRYLKLTGGTMVSNALITFADSGSWGTNNGPQGARGGLYWTGQSDYAKLYAEETAGDNLDLVIQFGDDNSNGLSIRNKANTQTSYISAGGVITTGTFKGNLDWSYITNKPTTATRWPSWTEVTGKPSSFTPSAHNHTYIVAEDLRYRYPGQILDPQRMKLSFLTASTLGIKNDGSYYDVITVRSYADSSGGSDNALLFSKSTNSLYHTRFAFGATDSWGNPLLIIDSGNIGSQSVAYASKAGNADTVDGIHANGLFTAFQASGNATRLVIGGVTKDLTIPYASQSPFLCKNSTFNSTGYAGLQYYDGDMSNTTNNNSWSVPSSGWHQILHLPLSVSGYFTELSFPVNDVNGLAWRQRRSSSYYGWYRILDSNNYSSYVKKIGTSTVGSSSIPIYLNAGTPTQCSTTLGVSITGNAATATILQTTRTLWGQSFNGSNNVSGSLFNTGTITASAAATYDIGSNALDYRHGYFQWIGAKSNTNLRLAANNSDNQIVLHTNGNVGIGTNTPAYKLDIRGDIRATGQIIRNGSSQVWVNGRNGALLRETTSTGYHTLWSLKTTNGSWDFGEYNISGWNNIPVLSYITDTNFNSGNNTTTYQIKFPLDSGTIALTKNIPSSLKNPYSLTLQANGTTLVTYDGSAAKSINITPGSIGAATSEHNHNGRYLRLDGSDTMTGVLKVKENQYNDGYDGAINMNNSDIYGLNSIYTADKSDGQAEGIHFWRDSTHVDTLRMMDGKLLFTPNRPLGGSGTEQTVLHTGNSHIKGGIITINGSSLTPLTSLPSHTHSWDSITGKPSSLKNPYSLNVFGVTYDGSAAKTVTTSNFISQLSEGTSTVTDGTMFITSWASDSGFADTNAVNVPYKRKASCLWSYIDSKVSSKYLPLAGGTMNGNARIGHGSGNLYIGNSGNDGWIYTQDIASQKGTDKWNIRESGAAHFGLIHIASKNDETPNGNIIESSSGYNMHLNCFSNGNVSLCNGGGNVSIGTSSPAYKLDVNGQVRAGGFHHGSINSDNYILLAGGGYKSYGGSASNPIFLGYLNLYHGNDGTIDSYFYCLGYSVPFTYTRGGNYCKISIPNTTHQVFFIKAAIASVNYSGGGIDNWTGEHRGDGAWWLHCYASGNNDVRVKGFRNSNGDNDSWWGGNPLYSGSGSANVITVCLFGYVNFE